MAQSDTSDEERDARAAEYILRNKIAVHLYEEYEAIPTTKCLCCGQYRDVEPRGFWTNVYDSTSWWLHPTEPDSNAVRCCELYGLEDPFPTLRLRAELKLKLED
jgi:hypothetical protein